MKFYLALLVVLAIPILLLVWRRYGHPGHPGAPGTDAQAHKNLAKNGEAPNQGSSRPYR